MCSRFLSALLFLPAFAFAAELRVCAEPDNLPYSHNSRPGFENRIAEVLAAELGLALRTVWHPQRRGFVRKTLAEGLCDAWIGVPTDFERTLNTRPYYRSFYVFVGKLRTFHDLRLTHLRIGVLLPGDDLTATPAGHALAALGAVKNIVGYTVYGERPAAQRIVEAIAKGELDAAVLWGPQVGFFAREQGMSVERALAPAGLEVPFEFGISVGVKRGEKTLRDALDGALERRRREIEALLDEYAVPRQ